MTATKRGRGSTSTTNFGSGRREAHDASAFYERFVAPEVSTDDTVNAAGALDVIHCGDSRSMTQVADDSVALVVTSPPYFAGKAYEEDLSADGVPSDYLEYLELLHGVFSECRRVLEPGGRIAVNVANLGRRPYRSLSGDVTRILEDLGLLMRGEVIWCKGRAAGGSCAWGTFQSPSNPVLRDVTERILIAGKGRFDRAHTQRRRHELGLPSSVTISKEEFMEATTDLWEIAPESARRVGHPAPFPVELPQRLIDLYTYRGDVVLDPFMGSGSTAIAAVATGRHYIGFDTDETYVSAANERISVAREASEVPPQHGSVPVRVEIPAVPLAGSAGQGAAESADPPAGTAADAVTGASTLGPQYSVIRSGRQVRELAEVVLAEAGFTGITAAFRPRGLGVVVDLSALDASGRLWLFDVSGSFSVGVSGLRRTETLWRCLGQASVLHEGLGGAASAPPLVLLTISLPQRGTAGARALSAVRGPGRPVHDVIDLLSVPDQDRLRSLALGGGADPGTAA